MKKKFLVLQTIQALPLQLAMIRSMLSGLFYIEIDNTFYVSCNKSFKDTFSKTLTENSINFIIVYVNLKPGCEVFTNGINENDKKNIENIVLDN